MAARISVSALAKQVGEALANSASFWRVGLSSYFSFLSDAARLVASARHCAICDPAEQSFRDMHRIEVSVPCVDGSQHVFANPATRIRQGFEHVRPSKEKAALPFEQVAGVETEG